MKRATNLKHRWTKPAYIVQPRGVQQTCKKCGMRMFTYQNMSAQFRAPRVKAYAPVDGPLIRARWAPICEAMTK